MLRERSTARQQAVLRGESETIATRLVKDRAAFTDLPATTFDACDQRPGRLSSQALVRYRNNDYSVPVAYAHREVIVKGYVGEVVITSGSEEIARHRRSYESADFVFDPLHYLPLLEEKGEPLERSAHAPTVRETTANALDQAAPLQGWGAAAGVLDPAPAAGGPAELEEPLRCRKARVRPGPAPARDLRDGDRPRRRAGRAPARRDQRGRRPAPGVGTSGTSSGPARHRALSAPARGPHRQDRRPLGSNQWRLQWTTADYMALMTGRT